MRGMSNTHSLILAGLLLASSSPAFAEITGIQAGTSGGVHGEVQIAKAEYAPSQRQIGHQIGSGEPIYMGDQIATGAGGGLQVMLLDQTVMTLGQNAKMTVDEMVYDPKSGAGKLNFNVSQGAFRFVSGQIAKANPENVKITTPLATIGIRGTIVGGAVDGNNAVVALLGPGGETNTSARHGAIEVTTPSGTVNISRTGFATTITPGQPPSPPTPATPAQLQQFGQAGAGSSGTAAAGTGSTTTTSNSGSTSTDQTTNPSPGTTGSKPADITGDTLVRGGPNSTLSPQPPVIIDTKDLTPPIKKKTIDDAVVASNNSNNNSSSASWDSLIGSAQTLRQDTNYNSLYYCGTCYNGWSGGYVDGNSVDATSQLTMNSLTNWTLTDPTNSANSFTVSSWTTSADAAWPANTKTATATSNGTPYVINDMSDATGLSYMKFGTWISGNTTLNISSSVDTSLGVYAFGVATPTNAMPTGSATYSGTAVGYGQSAGLDGDVYATVYAYKATANLTVNFSSNTFSGTITSPTFTNLLNPNGTPFTSISLNSGTISGNGFSGTSITVNGAPTYGGGSTTHYDTTTGSYGGKFYGTSAVEAGGTFTVAGDAKNYVTGSFGTKKN